MTPELLAQLAAALEKMQNAPEADDIGTMSDDDLAVHALRNCFSGEVKFNRQRGWSFFPAGAHFWHTDRSGDDVTSQIQTMLRELRTHEKDQRRAQYLGSRMRRDAVVDMLKGLPEVRDSGDWDNDPDVLAVPNGVVCLRTGELMEGTPGQRITKAAKVPYDPDAKCPRFEQFLREIFADDPEMPAYMGRLLGYGLTGRTDEQAFAVFHGSGSNGKSVLLTVLRNILGDHAVTVPFDMFTTSGKARGGPDAELLVGARLALASETNRSAVLDSAAVKNATGGEEITVNPKYRDPYSFKPIALILLATNYRPTVKEQDEGTWRRIKLVPFSQKFEGAQKDLTLHETLADEYPGILAWLVRGSVEWYANGLQDPESVRLAVQEYRESSDPLDGFYPGVLEPFPGGRVTNADAWNAYTNWAANEGVDAFRQSSTLSKALIERGRGAVGTAKSGPKRYLTGVRISGAPVGPPGPGIFDTAG